MNSGQILLKRVPISWLKRAWQDLGVYYWSRWLWRTGRYREGERARLRDLTRWTFTRSRYLFCPLCLAEHPRHLRKIGEECRVLREYLVKTKVEGSQLSPAALPSATTMAWAKSWRQCPGRLQRKRGLTL